MNKKRKFSLGSALLNAPYFAWAALFIVIPLAVVLLYAFYDWSAEDFDHFSYDGVVVSFADPDTGEVYEKSLDITIRKDVQAEKSGAVKNGALTVCPGNWSDDFKNARSKTSEFDGNYVADLGKLSEYSSSSVETKLREITGLGEEWEFILNDLDDEPSEVDRVSFCFVNRDADGKGRTLTMGREVKLKAEIANDGTMSEEVDEEHANLADGAFGKPHNLFNTAESVTDQTLSDKIDARYEELLCETHGDLNLQFGTPASFTNETLGEVISDIFGYPANVSRSDPGYSSLKHTMDGGFTLAHMASVLTYGDTILKSLLYSVLATLITFLIAYPFVYAVCRLRPASQKIANMFVTLPMWINLLIKTYCLSALMDGNGLINQALVAIGFGKLPLMNNTGAVIFGMVYNYLPYMILPIYNVMSKIEPSLLEAASDLGCGAFSRIRRVIFPLTVPGIVSGIIMVFVPSVSTFYISAKMGGTGDFMIGDLIEGQIHSQNNNLPVAAALSAVLMAIILVSMLILNRFTENDEGGSVLI